MLRMLLPLEPRSLKPRPSTRATLSILEVSFPKHFYALRFGPILSIVNNAGVMLLGDTDVQNPAEWTQMIDVNVKGVMIGCQLVLKGVRYFPFSPLLGLYLSCPQMYERKKGTIINISSIAGRKTFPNHSVYCATKFAVHAFTEALREEASQHNVRVCIVAPGVVETEVPPHPSFHSQIRQPNSFFCAYLASWSHY